MERNIDLIVTDAQKGCPEAMEEIFELYREKLYRLTMGMTGNREDAEDLLQEIFTKIFVSLHGFKVKPGGGFTTWVLRVGTNHSISYVKKHRGYGRDECELKDEFMADTSSPPDNVEKAEIGTIVLKKLGNLSPKQRAVIIHRYYNGLTIREIGGAMKCHEGSVKRHLYRGLDKLRRLLGMSEEVGNEV